MASTPAPVVLAGGWEVISQQDREVGPRVQPQCYLPAGFQCLSEKERLVNNPF